MAKESLLRLGRFSIHGGICGAKKKEREIVKLLNFAKFSFTFLFVLQIHPHVQDEERLKHVHR